jgi:hypothetical protein
MKKSVRKRGEDWFEPVLNRHTPLSPTLTPIFVDSFFFNPV